MKIVKTVFVYLLLTVFLFNTVGYFVAFKSVQWNIRKQAKQAILKQVSKKDLIEKKFKNADFAKLEWKDNGKEFELGNELFDVVEIERSEQEIIVYCMNDKKEEELLSHLDEHIQVNVSNTNESHKKSSKKITDTVLKLYFNNLLSFNFNRTVEKIIFINSLQLYQSNYLSLNTPPPELV